MKQVFYNNLGEVYVKEVESPTLQGKGAVVRTICSFIGTGSEVHGVLRYRQSSGDGQEEFATSYQSCGRIVELSPDVMGFQIGDLVACTGMGFATHAQLSYVPAHMFAKVPDGVTPEEAATCNLGQTAVHALRRSRFQFGETVVVIGLGLVGQILARLVQASGGIAIGTDLVDARLDLARAAGITAAINPRRDDVVEAVRQHTDGDGADAVVICAVAPNSSEPLEQACAMARDKGRVVIVGLVKIGIGFSALRSKELDLLIARGRGPGTGDSRYEREGVDYPLGYVPWSENRNLQAYLHLLATGMLHVRDLITHRFPLDRAPDAFEVLIQNPENALGVVIEYNAD